jgi:hypothetical protein
LSKTLPWRYRPSGTRLYQRACTKSESEPRFEAYPQTGSGSVPKLLGRTIARGGIDPIRVSRRIRGRSGFSAANRTYI